MTLHAHSPSSRRQSHVQSDTAPNWMATEERAMTNTLQPGWEPWQNEYRHGAFYLFVVYAVPDASFHFEPVLEFPLGSI